MAREDAHIRRWINASNERTKPCAWTKTADETPDTLAAYCRRVSASGH